ncbi:MULTISPECIES: hypothetical protein [Sphingobium]|jgi:hypothetical protein|uniref:Uncharacterized protein n=1 Tax=Sphingobium baderi TaxID=1332080 RepID=A0A0S3EXP6_9SPHN|nr:MULTISPECIES: hypothetical protein [Sphingobium]ALR20198.1 hypothetical protein ATN00_07660 [Sphingobium baderi]OAN58759.1 hypothetical protein A7Q26_14170 [Sphingobium sp. TCM1]
MLPSIDLRIANIVKSLEQVVLPALGPRERLAKDQIGLCIGHLRMIGEQWRWAAAFEGGSFDAMVALAEAMRPSVDPFYVEELGAAIEAGKAVDKRDLAAVEHGILVLGGLIDRIILGEDGKVELAPAARDAVLAYGAAQSIRERTWFAATGLDPDGQDLPDIPAMMAS